MGLVHISHVDISRFAKERVNLPPENAEAYRAQAQRLQDKLQAYVDEHPDFNLKRMVLSGSLAKGTALRSLNDIDVGCYLTGVDKSTDVAEIISFLVKKLQTAFPNFSPDQIKPQTYCVTVSFRGSGLDVDIVPILYYGDKSWYGDLVNQRDGSFLKTSIPRHIEFINKRKSENKKHFSQVVRLVKYWAKKQKTENQGFRFKSFMIELILAKLADRGMDFSDYPEALQHFFTYLASTNLSELIAFSDYFPESALLNYSDPIQIIDPVNFENNAASLYTKEEAKMISEAALDAGDAIDAALYATTKGKTIEYWQNIFGPSFNP
jgi:tRNA nucleotidyltransferase (CCA-adding enzyme)